MHAWHTLDDTSITLTRTPHVEQLYKAHIARVLATFPTMSHYIRDKVLANTTGLYLTLNKFPYDLEPNVSHFILWNPQNAPLHHCKYHIHTQFSPTFFNICLRQNLPHQRSVPDIPHYHIFVRRRQHI